MTGTAFLKSLVQLPYAVAVSSRRTLAEQGSPQAVGNVLDADPPLVNWEQSYDAFTHSPKGRRIKLSVTYRPGT